MKYFETHSSNSFGGENITNDIKTGLGVLKTQAEQMKVQFGSALANEAKSMLSSHSWFAWDACKRNQRENLAILFRRA